MDAMLLLEGEALKNVYAEFRRVYLEHDRGLTLLEFVRSFIDNVRSEIDKHALVKLLGDLFQQIDVNGDQTLEWSEFTSFCIEAGMAATAPRIPRPTFYFLYDQRFEDKITRTPVMLQLSYHPVLDAVVTIERNSKIINIMNSKLQLMRTLDATSSIRKSLRDIDTSVPLRHVLLPPFRMIAVLMSNLAIPLWIITPRSCLYNGTLHRVDAETSPCMLHFDDASKLLLVGCTNGTMLGYNPEMRKLVLKVRHHSDVVLSITSALNRAAVITSSLDGLVLLWDLERRKVTRTLEGSDGAIEKLLCVPKLDLLLGLSVRNVVVGWDLGIAEIVMVLAGHTSRIKDMTIVPTNPPRLITMDENSVFKLWELAAPYALTCPCLSTFRIEKLSGHFPALCVLAAPQRLRDVRTEFWMAEQTAVHPKEDADNESPGAGIVGDLIVAAPRLHRITTFPLELGEPPAAALYNEPMMCFVAVMPHDVLLWDADSGGGSSVFVDASVSTEVTCACFDDRRRKLYLGRQDGSVLTINLQNGALMKQGHIHRGAVTAVIYNDEDRCLISAASDGSLVIYDDEPQGFLDDLRVVRHAHAIDITALAFSYEQSLVITGDREGCIRCWDFQDLKLMADAVAHRSPITALAAMGPYPFFLSADSEGNMLLWSSRGQAQAFQVLYRFCNAHLLPEVFDPDDEPAASPRGRPAGTGGGGGAAADSATARGVDGGDGGDTDAAPSTSPDPDADLRLPVIASARGSTARTSTQRPGRVGFAGGGLGRAAAGTPGGTDRSKPGTASSGQQQQRNGGGPAFTRGATTGGVGAAAGRGGADEDGAGERRMPPRPGTAGSATSTSSSSYRAPSAGTGSRPASALGARPGTAGGFPWGGLGGLNSPRLEESSAADGAAGDHGSAQSAASSAAIKTASGASLVESKLARLAKHQMRHSKLARAILSGTSRRKGFASAAEADEILANLNRNMRMTVLVEQIVDEYAQKHAAVEGEFDPHDYHRQRNRKYKLSLTLEDMEEEGEANPAGIVLPPPPAGRKMDAATRAWRQRLCVRQRTVQVAVTAMRVLLPGYEDEREARLAARAEEEDAATARNAEAAGRAATEAALAAGVDEEAAQMMGAAAAEAAMQARVSASSRQRADPSERLPETDILLATADDRGRMRLARLTQVVQRTGLQPVQRYRWPVCQHSYSARRRTHREAPGPIITDEQWFFTDGGGGGAMDSGMGAEEAELLIDLERTLARRQAADAARGAVVAEGSAHEAVEQQGAAVRSRAKAPGGGGDDDAGAGGEADAAAQSGQEASSAASHPSSSAHHHHGPPIGMTISLKGHAGVGIVNMIAGRRTPLASGIMKRAAIMAGVPEATTAQAADAYAVRARRGSMLLQASLLKSLGGRVGADGPLGSVASMLKIKRSARRQTVPELPPLPGDVTDLSVWAAHPASIASMLVFRLQRVRAGAAAVGLPPPPRSDTGREGRAEVPELRGYFATTCGTDGRIYLWSLQEGRRVGELGNIPQDEDAIAAGTLHRVPWRFPVQGPAVREERDAEAAQVLLDVTARRAEEEKAVQATRTLSRLEELRRQVEEQQRAAEAAAEAAAAELVGGEAGEGEGGSGFPAPAGSTEQRPRTGAGGPSAASDASSTFITAVGLGAPSQPVSRSGSPVRKGSAAERPSSAADASPRLAPLAPPDGPAGDATACAPQRLAPLDAAGVSAHLESDAALGAVGTAEPTARAAELATARNSVSVGLRHLNEAGDAGKGRQAIRRLSQANTTNTFIALVLAQTQQRMEKARREGRANGDGEAAEELREGIMVPPDKLLLGDDAAMLHHLDIYDEGDALNQHSADGGAGGGAPGAGGVSASLMGPRRPATISSFNPSHSALTPASVTFVLNARAPATMAATTLGAPSVAVLALSGYEPTGVPAAKALTSVASLLRHKDRAALAGALESAQDALRTDEEDSAPTPQAQAYGAVGARASAGPESVLGAADAAPVEPKRRKMPAALSGFAAGPVCGTVVPLTTAAALRLASATFATDGHGEGESGGLPTAAELRRLEGTYSCLKQEVANRHRATIAATKEARHAASLLELEAKMAALGSGEGSNGSRRSLVRPAPLKYPSAGEAHLLPRAAASSTGLLELPASPRGPAALQALAARRDKLPAGSVGPAGRAEGMPGRALPVAARSSALAHALTDHALIGTSTGPLTLPGLRPHPSMAVVHPGGALAAAAGAGPGDLKSGFLAVLAAAGQLEKSGAGGGRKDAMGAVADRMRAADDILRMADLAASAPADSGGWASVGGLGLLAEQGSVRSVRSAFGASPMGSGRRLSRTHQAAMGQLFGKQGEAAADGASGVAGGAAPPGARAASSDDGGSGASGTAASARGRDFSSRTDFTSLSGAPGSAAAAGAGAGRGMTPKHSELILSGRSDLEACELPMPAPGVFMPTMFGPYNALEVVKVRDIFSECDPQRNGEALIEALRRHPFWDRMYTPERANKVRTVLSSRVEKALTLREFFTLVFAGVNRGVVEAMVKWTDPAVAAEAGQQEIAWKKVLPPDVVEELTAVFEAMDVDNSGTVSIAEIKDALSRNKSRTHMDMNWSVFDIEDIVNSYDENKNAELDIDEFMQLMAEAIISTSKVSLR